MLPYDLLPDPTPLGGDQPRGRAGAGRGVARRDDHPGGVRTARTVAPPLRQRPTRPGTQHDSIERHLSEPSVSLSQEGYKYGFVTDIEADERAAWPRPRTRSASSRPRRKSRNGCSNGGSPRSAPGATMTPPSWAKAPSRADRLSGRDLLFRAEAERRARNRSTRSIPSCCAPMRSSASRCASARLLAGVAVDAVFDSVSVATTFKDELGEARHHLLLDRRGGAASTPSWCAAISAPWCRRTTISSRR